MRTAARITAGLAIVAGAALFALQFADGPLGPLPGGPLRSGEPASLADGWTPENGQSIELELVGYGDSRTTGILLHDGRLYVPCDLGYIGRRIPSRPARWLAMTIATFKHWHEDAARDGRAVVRADGRLYRVQALRETDPERLAALRSIMARTADRQTRRDLSSPLLDVPVEDDEIWFFRLAPR